MDDKTCKAVLDEETVTVEENGKPPMTIIHEGPTQPEERVQMNDELQKVEEEAEEDDESDCMEPEQSGSFAVGMRTFMKEALKEAKKASDEGEIPIGAIVIKNGKIISRAHNLKEKLNDPTAHAEILALREAAQILGDWRLSGCELYVTAEPCPMCLGALFQTRISRLVYGTSEPKFGAIESALRFEDTKAISQKLDIYSGILEDECAEILEDFFKNKRIAN